MRIAATADIHARIGDAERLRSIFFRGLRETRTCSS